MQSNNVERDEIAEILLEFQQQSTGLTNNIFLETHLVNIYSYEISDKKTIVLEENGNKKRKFESSQFQGEIKKVKGPSVNEVMKDKSSSLNEILEGQIVCSMNVDTENEQQTAPINKLDYDCLERIFVNLPPENRLNASQVCIKWKDASRFAWADLKKLEYKHGKSDCRDPKNCQCYVTLHDIKLKFNYIPNLFLQCGQYVQDLDVSKFTDSIILTAIKGCFPNLLKLNITLYEWKDEDVTGLFDGMTKLEYLCIQWYQKKMIPLTFFQALNAVANTLSDLTIASTIHHVENIPKLTKYYLDDYFSLTISRFQSLRRLVLQGFLWNTTLVEAISRLKNLEELNTLVCSCETHEILDPILGLINLKKFLVGYQRDNLERFLINIPDKLKNLTTIIINNENIITDVEILALTKLEKLEHITLRNTSKQLGVTDDSIKKFKNMKSLCFNICPMVTDDSIIHLLNSCPNLEKIIFSRTGITFKSIECIVNTMRARANGTPLDARFFFWKEPPFKSPKNLPPNLTLEIKNYIDTRIIINA